MQNKANDEKNFDGFVMLTPEIEHIIFPPENEYVELTPEDEFIELTPEEHQKYIQMAIDESFYGEEKNLKQQDFSLDYINKLMSKYPYWIMTSYDFYDGPDSNVYYMPHEEGIGGRSLNQVRERIRNTFEKCEKLLINEPRFYIDEEENWGVRILLALRSTKESSDYEIYGTLEKISRA